jgi:hypothetical protein
MIRSGLFSIALLLLAALSVYSASDSTRVYRDLDCDGFDDAVINSSAPAVPDFTKLSPSLPPDTAHHSQVLHSMSPAISIPNAIRPTRFADRWQVMLDLTSGQYSQLSFGGAGTSRLNSNNSACAGGVCGPR